MTRTQRLRPTGAAVVIGAMIGAIALAGCGSGQITQTSSSVPAVNGASARSGQVLVRDARIEFGKDGGGFVYQRGGSAPLAMTIVNQGTEGDRLISAASPAASSAPPTGNLDLPPGQVIVVGGLPAAAVPVTSAASTAAPGTARPSATATATSVAGAVRKAQIVLTGLRDDIHPGLTYPVVLTFQKAGEIRVDVPVGSPPAKDEHGE